MMADFTEREKHVYLDHENRDHTSACPACGSPDTKRIGSSGGYTKQFWMCRSCKQDWIAILQLVDIRRI